MLLAKESWMDSTACEKFMSKLREALAYECQGWESPTDWYKLLMALPGCWNPLLSSNCCLNTKSQSSILTTPMKNAGPCLEENSSVHFKYEFALCMCFGKKQKVLL